MQDYFPLLGSSVIFQSGAILRFVGLGFLGLYMLYKIKCQAHMKAGLHLLIL